MLAATALAGAGAAAAAPDPGAPAPDRAPAVAATPAAAPLPDTLDGTARWLAGLIDDPAAPVSAAQRRAHEAWRQLASRRTGPMQAFASSQFAAERSACRTLFYPFSGPDVLNAVTLFPYCDRYLLFGLEPVGDLPRPAAMAPAQRAAVLDEMARAQDWMIRRNFFITNAMRDDLNTRHVHGVLPLMVAMLARTGHRIVELRPANLDGTPREPGQAGRPRAVTIVFERLGGVRQELFYASFDASDRGLKARPGFLQRMAGEGEVITLLKAASYLLHQPDFARMRELVETRSTLIVQDDSGLPYRRLVDAGFEVALYGQYTRTIPVFGYRFQKDLAAAYQGLGPQPPLGFDWSYIRDRAHQSLQVARRAGGPPRRGA